MLSEDFAALRIRTPEGVVFSYRTASPVTRMLAWWVDAAAIMVLYSLVSVLSFSVLGVFGVSVGNAARILVAAFVNLAYFIALEWKWNGRTLGKRLLRLRVIDAAGLRLELSQVVTRNILRIIDGLPILYVVGGLAATLSPRCRRLGDIAAATVVVHVPKRRMPDLAPVDPGKYNSFRTLPVQAARLRQNVTPEQAMIALDALARREQLDPDARLTLFREMAGYFLGLARFPEEALLGLSDEQIVRNVVEIVLTPART